MCAQWSQQPDLMQYLLPSGTCGEKGGEQQTSFMGANPNMEINNTKFNEYI